MGKYVKNERWISCTDEGSLLLVSKSCKIEKRVENAHPTAIICIRWNSDSQAITTCGEDGLTKIWLKQGVLKFKLVENPSPVHSLAWIPDENTRYINEGKIWQLNPYLKVLIRHCLGK